MDWSDWAAKHKINIPGCRARRYLAAGRAVNDGRHETLCWHYGIMHRGRLLGYRVICSHCSQRFFTREADPCLELEHTPLAKNIVHTLWETDNWSPQTIGQPLENWPRPWQSSHNLSCIKPFFSSQGRKGCLQHCTATAMLVLVLVKVNDSYMEMEKLDEQ